ncbi:MAG: hypothetical protein DCC68_21635 [Planctomycetota bacterium]|nr:MAG: hypothetical protein DCC68_21635 [Planctomycetota bacterium]
MAVVVLAAGIVAWFWPNAGYDPDRVHPVLRELREPFREVQAGYYLDGGSVSVRVVDATGREVNVVFKVEWHDRDDGRLLIWVEDGRGRNNLPNPPVLARPVQQIRHLNLGCYLILDPFLRENVSRRH